MVWTTVACVRPSIALTHACTCGYPTAEAVILIPPLSIIGVFAGSVYDCLALLSPLNVSTPQGRSPTRGRIYAHGSLSLIINFQLASREESIYGYMTASVPKRVGPFESPLTAWAGPYIPIWPPRSNGPRSRRRPLSATQHHPTTSLWHSNEP